MDDGAGNNGDNELAAALTPGVKRFALSLLIPALFSVLVMGWIVQAGWSWVLALSLLVAGGVSVFAWAIGKHRLKIIVNTRMLEKEIAGRSADLRRTVLELRAARTRTEDAEEEARRARQQLAEAEKMAALGSLAAGVAHRIDTPVGTSLTAAALLEERIHEFEEMISSSRIDKADLAATAIVGQLPAHPAVLAADATAADVEAAFKSLVDLPGLLVVKDGELLGLLSRQRFMELMTHPFAPALYLRRPLSQLPTEFWQDPLIVPEDEPIAEISYRALSRPLERSCEPLVVHSSDGSLRVLDMRVLLLAQGQILSRYAASMETTLDALQGAQDNLVEARKMAALGTLVAGIAHEINTPVGISLTAATLLEERIRKFKEIIEGGQLKKAALTRYLDLAEESAGLLLSNIHRAAEMIQSFKQVAVDQASAERRCFNLADYLDEVLTSLQPRLRQSAVEVSVSCDDRIVMNSFPGAFSQVVTNLVMNALIHAFGDDQAGHIRLEATQTKRDWMRLCFSDNGKGIAGENLGRIFEPFFTTRRGTGGTGLGLHIVYNIVSRQLGGTIAVESTPGEGTSFILDLPLQPAADGNGEAAVA